MALAGAVCSAEFPCDQVELGCHNDMRNRSLRKFYQIPSDQDSCVKGAKKHNMRFYGLQWVEGGTECWLENDAQHAIKYGASTCGKNGTHWKNYIY